MADGVRLLGINPSSSLHSDRFANASASTQTEVFVNELTHRAFKATHSIIKKHPPKKWGVFFMADGVRLLGINPSSSLHSDRLADASASTQTEVFVNELTHREFKATLSIIKNTPQKNRGVFFMADGVRFELTVESPPRRFSRPEP